MPDRSGRPENNPDNPFWNFSLKVYSQKGVPEACLALQERHGVDVNLILYFGWIGALGGGALSGDRVTRTAAAVEVWHRQVVVSLRTVRAGLKVDQYGAPAVPAGGLRRQIKATELAAERIEQDMLYELGMPDDGADAPAGRRVGDAKENIFAYLAVLGVDRSAEDEADTTMIADACARFADVAK